jgi:hypothetical protein
MDQENHFDANGDKAQGRHYIMFSSGGRETLRRCQSGGQAEKRPKTPGVAEVGLNPMPFT